MKNSMEEGAEDSFQSAAAAGLAVSERKKKVKMENCDDECDEIMSSLFDAF